jgi:anaerobic magnesium-protoporphyrin IX monomethyl ester cyclase
MGSTAISGHSVQNTGSDEGLNSCRFEGLCHAIIDAGLNALDYFVQGMTLTIANQGETLAPLMHRAGIRYVFLGIENI